MNQQQLLDVAEKILENVRKKRNHFAGTKAEVCEFLRLYAGPKTSFYKIAEMAAGGLIQEHLATIMESYISFVKAGLYADISPERKARLDVVSDLLEQAHILLENEKVHPAAPAVLIGATLEEFLRNWTEAEDIPCREEGWSGHLLQTAEGNRTYFKAGFKRHHFLVRN